MTAPQTAWVRLAWALGLGLGLGLLYGFLRPLRRRSHWPADLLFVAAAFYAWVYLSFGICRGDIRMGATAAMGLGALTWEMTLGRLLRRPFSMVWQGIGWIFGVIFLPIRKIFKIFRKILKKVFASAKKRGTIGWNICRESRQTFGGTENEKTQKSPGQCAAGLPARQGADQDRPAGGDRAVHRRPHHHPHRHRPQRKKAGGPAQ